MGRINQPCDTSALVGWKDPSHRTTWPLKGPTSCFWFFHTFLGGATLMPPKITFMISRFMASSNGRKVFIARICQHFVPCKWWQFFTASKRYHNCSLDSVVHCQHLPTEKRQETLEQKSHASFSESTWGSLHTWSWSEWHLMAIQRWYHSKAMLWCLWIWESQKSQYLWRVTTSGNSTHLFETMGRWLEIFPKTKWMKNHGLKLTMRYPLSN